MSPSKSLFYFCIAFVLGVALSSIVSVPQIIIWVFLLLGILIIFTPILLKEKRFIILGFCVCFFVIGIVRFQISEFTIASDKLSKLNDQPAKITLNGAVVSEPKIKDTSQKLIVKVDDSLVLVTVGRYPEYRYLDAITMTGKLKTPVILDDFNYRDYLAKDGIYSMMDFPTIKVVPIQNYLSPISFLYKKILWVKEKLTTSIDMSFSSPESFIMQGIIFGDDDNTPKELKEKFNVTGLSHLTAVSGSNIIMVIFIVTTLFLFLGFWRHWASYASIIFIWFYIVAIGFPMSGVRAGIMGSVFLLAQTLGRQGHGLRVLSMAGAIMILHNPLLLFYDIGFQLSFLASLGIIYLKTPIDYFLNRPIKGEFFLKREVASLSRFFIDIISITFATQVFTLPIIVYNFGRLSLVAPITNLLVLPIIPILTILGFFNSILGAFSNVLGFIISLPSLFLLKYFFWVIEVFYQPWAVAIIKDISWVWVVIYYIILAGAIWLINFKLKFLGF